MGEDLERADEDLRHERGDDGRAGEDDERELQRPALDFLVARDVHRRVPAQRVPRQRDVGEQQHDRNRDRERDESVTVGVAVPARDRRDQQDQRRRAHEPERDEARPAVDLAAAAEEEREAEDEQQVPDHGAGQRATHDLVQPFVDGEQRDDQLGGVAEGGVEEAADAGAGVLGGVLRRLADQPRERDQRRGGEDELDGLVEVERVVHERRRAARSRPRRRGRGGP